jgi:hypothetical protein
VLPNDRILVAGETARSTDAGRAFDFAVAYYTSAGALDTSFGSNGLMRTPFPGQVSGSPVALVLDAQGRLVVSGVGVATMPDGGVARFLDIARYGCL